MSYTKQTWVDYPDTSTPITATRLTHIEQGIYDAHTMATPSTDTGNALKLGNDGGLFVSASSSVGISTDADNALVKGTDNGLYVPKSANTTISKEAGNSIVQKSDGIYCGVATIVDITQANYDKLTDAEKNASNVIYNITDESTTDLSTYAKKTEIPKISTDTGNALKLGTDSGWFVSSSGGSGTTVVGNPTGTATESLTKLQIDSKIYSVSGGSSGSGLSYKNLYSDNAEISSGKLLNINNTNVKEMYIKVLQGDLYMVDDDDPSNNSYSYDTVVGSMVIDRNSVNNKTVYIPFNEWANGVLNANAVKIVYEGSNQYRISTIKQSVTNNGFTIRVDALYEE